MKILSNGCRRSDISVLPANWKTTSSCRKPWRIYYRFHCPGLTGAGTKFPKGKMVVISGMNSLRTADERRSYVRGMIEAIQEDLDIKEYNPITGYRKIDEPEFNFEINPDTFLKDALQTAHQKLDIATTTKGINKSVLGYVQKAARELKMDRLPAGQVKRRHIMMIMERCAAIKKEKWTAGTYNLYRSHLQMLFKIMVTWEAMEHNPVDDNLPKKKEIKKIRPTLTGEQMIAIDQGLKKDNYRFWLFMQIFFYSGARETEMVLVRKEDVNLKAQEVSYTILKGDHRVQIRPIPDNAVHLWEQALEGSSAGQYLFSKGLKPGNKSIRPEQITRRWRNWVKNKTDENGNKIYGENVADFYSLKHSHRYRSIKKGRNAPCRHPQSSY